jgi:transitional endoplasmic reticulum ATPase
MAVWPSQGSRLSPTFRGFLWIAIGSVFVLSFLLYSPVTKTPGINPGPLDWLFQSWPALLAAACAMWLLLNGPLSASPSWVQKACRVVLVFFVYSGFLYFLRWPPFWTMMQSLGFISKNKETGVLVLIATIVWMIATVRVIVPGGLRLPAVGLRPRLAGARAPDVKTTRPTVRFADVGGMEEAKSQIRQVVENRLQPGKLGKYGVVRNGILLHGPRGSGKTFLAEATAGEFGMNYFYLSPTQLLVPWVGETQANIRDGFKQAIARRPALLFIDELDSLGSSRQILNRESDPGGAGRSYNNNVIQLMQMMDQYRSTPRLLLMAATNVLDGLDPALIREGRFDLQIRVDLPDEPTRRHIFESQLLRKPWRRCDLEEFARRTPGASAAKIKSIVDRAAAFAAEQNRLIEEGDLRRALDETGGRDRPLFQPVEWLDLIVEEDVERDLRTLVKQLNAGWSSLKILATPTGLLLIGPPGTGKTMIGRLIATQSRRSFYPLSAADILGGQIGASVKKLSEIFARARENNPSIIFFDEIDGLLPRNNGMLSTHDAQLVEQCRTEISQLLPEHNVFLIGTTNYLDRIDPAILRGGRFSEKIEIGPPGPANRERLLRKYLDRIQIEVAISAIAERLAGLAPADIEAICKAAVRNALGRSERDNSIPPLVLADFERAIQRVAIRS